MGKNIEPKDGWKNRHLDGLPSDVCRMDIITNEGEERVWWTPYEPHSFAPEYSPAEGYLGHARRDTPYPMKRIGWNVWEQNNCEFVYYRVL